jgi:hypothetical protein
LLEGEYFHLKDKLIETIKGIKGRKAKFELKVGDKIKDTVEFQYLQLGKVEEHKLEIIDKYVDNHILLISLLGIEKVTPFIVGGVVHEFKIIYKDNKSITAAVYGI